MVTNKDLIKLFQNVNLEKMTKTDLLVLNSKLDILNQKIQNIISDELDNQDFIIEKHLEIMNIIKNRI